jgi:hypothetical protein
LLVFWVARTRRIESAIQALYNAGIAVASTASVKQHFVNFLVTPQGPGSLGPRRAVVSCGANGLKAYVAMAYFTMVKSVAA